MKALLVSGGNIEDLNLVKELAKDVDFVIGADAGTDYCLASNLVPNIIIGDLDSIKMGNLDIVKQKEIPILKFPIEKDNTDTELALDYLIEKGFKDITIIGAIGSRIDHTLGNIFLLKKLKDKKVKGKIIDGHNIIYLIDDELIVENRPNSYVSILPINDSGSIVSLDGFKYNLSKVQIDFSSTLGISNEIEKDFGYIKIHKGLCLVIISMD